MRPRRLTDALALAAAIAGIVLLVMLIAMTARAHTDPDLEADLAAHQAAIVGPDGTIDPDQLVAYLRLRAAHPCREATWTAACEAPRTQEATATPKPAPRPAPASVEAWRPLIAAHFGAYTDEALRVVACESGGDPNAQHPRSKATGLFQVLPSWAPRFGTTPDGLFDPATNVAIAKALFDDGASRGNRWSHWVCKP